MIVKNIVFRVSSFQPCGVCLEVLFVFYASLVLNCFTKSPFALKHGGLFHGSIWRTDRNIIGVGFQSQLKICAFFFFFQVVNSVTKTK